MKDIDVVLYQPLRIHRTRWGTIIVNIPFVCQKCGKCCREIGFPVESAVLPEIANYLSLSVEEFVEKYIGKILEDGRIEVDYEKLRPCPFLKGNICSIYPVRPNGCKLFPLCTDFMDQKIGCPGLKRFNEIVKKLIRGYTSYVFLPPESIKYNEIENVKVKIPSRIAEKYLQTNPPKEERKLFFELNIVKK